MAQLRVLYAKQLTQSDAACSKQIKLPKNEAKQFVGELKHRQSATLVVKDIRGNSWSFLCTCYGCQYALSRVGNFAKEFNLKAGDVLVFLEDENQQLVVAVNEHAPLHLKPPTKAARGSQRRKPARTSPVRPPSTDSQPMSVASSVEAPLLGQQFSLLMHDRGGSPSNVTSQSPHPTYALQPCFAYKSVATKRPHGHPVSLHAEDEDEDAHGDDSDRVECSTKRPCRSHDVHVKAEPAAAWAVAERRLAKQEPYLQDTAMGALDDNMQWRSSPGSSAGGRPNAWQQAPPARPLPLLAKVLTKMDVACAHDKVGVVLPRDDVQVSVILSLLQHHEQQQRRHQQQLVAYDLLQEPLQLQVVDLLRAEQRQLTSRDWMACRLTPSPNRRFWYLTGLGSFLKRHAAQHGQVLELSCCESSGTFWASVR